MRRTAASLVILCLVMSSTLAWAQSANLPSMFSRKASRPADGPPAIERPESSVVSHPETIAETAKPPAAAIRVKTATPQNAEAVLRSAFASVNTGMTEVVIRASDWDRDDRTHDRGAERPAGSPKARRGGGDASAQAKAALRWSYSGANGPDRWATLGPEFRACGKGQMQSPIDIWSNETVSIPNRSVSFAYEVVGIKKAAFPAGQLRILTQAGAVLNAGGAAWFLESIEFRWPGEGRVDGQAPLMSVYLHHRSAEGKHAIVSVPVVMGASDNAAFARIWAVMNEAGPGMGSFNPKDLLPSKLSHYHYIGSLTHPPCTEGVAWYVVREPIEFSRQQFLSYTRSFSANARPVQPRGKSVQVSFAP